MQPLRVQRRFVRPVGTVRWTATVLGATAVAVVALCGPAAAASSATASPQTATGATNGATTAPVGGTGSVPSPTTPTTAPPPTTTTTAPAPTPARNGTALTPFAGAGLNGVGSSFAAPAIETWDQDVGNAPYSLSLNYTSSNSGDGRYQFTNQTTDFAVSDIGYVGNTDTTPPSFPFIFVPITAGGIAFMYNIPGLSQTLQLSSYTACAHLDRGDHELERLAHRRRQPRGDAAQPQDHPGDRERLGRHQLRARGVVHRRAARPLGGVRPAAEQPVRRADRRGGHLAHLAQLQLAGRPRGSRHPVHDPGGR